MDPLSQQLDLFAHSRDVMLRNDALQALQQRDAGRARAARVALAAEAPADPLLPALATVARELEHRDDAPFADHDALAAERRRLDRESAPAARHVFGGADADVWLRPLRRTLAQRADALPFVAARADDHAATLWLQAEDWAAAAAAVQRIESWRRIPAPLAWMLEARCRSDGIDACWPLLAELAWLAPQRLAALRPRLPDPLLQRPLERFDAEFDGDGSADDLAWFPAWLANAQPTLAPRLALAQPGLQGAPERGLRLTVELIGLERQGRHHELMQRRKALRELHAGLFSAYMATR
jgi:hypothetical protein